MSADDYHLPKRENTLKGRNGGEARRAENERANSEARSAESEARRGKKTIIILAAMVKNDNSFGLLP